MNLQESLPATPSEPPESANWPISVADLHTVIDKKAMHFIVWALNGELHGRACESLDAANERAMVISKRYNVRVVAFTPCSVIVPCEEAK